MGNFPVHLTKSFRAGAGPPPERPPVIEARLASRLIVVACLAALGLCWACARGWLGF